MIKLFEKAIINHFINMIDNDIPMKINNKNDIAKYIVTFIKQIYQKNASALKQITDIDSFIHENCDNNYFSTFIQNHFVIIDSYIKLINEMNKIDFLTSFKSNILHDNSRMLDFQDFSTTNEIKNYIWKEIQKSGYLWLTLNIQDKYLDKAIIPIFILNDDDKEKFNLYLLKQFNMDKLLEAIQLSKNFANLKQLKVGDSIKLDHNFLHRLTHDPSFKPLIYINGNIITSDKTSNIAGHNYRAYHSELVRTYFDNMSLHKDDIIHLDENEWKNCNENNVNDSLNLTRAVIKENIVFIIAAPIQSIIEKFKSELNCPVFCITDNASGLERRAKRLIGKKVYKRIY